MIDPTAEVGRRVALMVNPSADLYGSDRMMLESVRGLRAEGWEVVVAASQVGPLTAELESVGARFVVVPVPVLRRSDLNLKGLLALATAVVREVIPMARFVREVRPDVIYVNTLTIPLWLAIGRILRVPTVNHVHEAESSTAAVARYGLTVPTRLASLVIYNSEVTRNVAAASGGRRACRTVVIYNGVASPSKMRPPREILAGTVRLVYVGRLSPRKGVDVAVRAVAELRTRHIDAYLEVVGAVFPGNEWYEAQLREQVRSAGLEERVFFRGFRHDVWKFLARADVVLMPSRGEESFGNTVVEAALSARPVVVSDHSGLREATDGRESAVLVAADDASAVASAVAELIEHWPRTRAQAVHDAEVASARFGTDRYRNELVGAIVNLIGERREERQQLWRLSGSAIRAASWPWKERDKPQNARPVGGRRSTRTSSGG